MRHMEPEGVLPRLWQATTVVAKNQLYSDYTWCLL